VSGCRFGHLKVANSRLDSRRASEGVQIENPVHARE
jgi:hypothetical protein